MSFHDYGQGPRSARETNGNAQDRTRFPRLCEWHSVYSIVCNLERTGFLLLVFRSLNVGGSSFPENGECQIMVL